MSLCQHQPPTLAFSEEKVNQQVSKVTKCWEVSGFFKNRNKKKNNSSEIPLIRFTYVYTFVGK